jgi:hypothetical protein
MFQSIDPTILRIATELERYRPLLAVAQARCAGTAETLVLVEDLLADVFGYDKGAEISAEYLERGACCDLALQFGGSPALLIETQPAGRPLAGADLARALDHAASQGCEWLALTNAIEWRVYHIPVNGPLDPELVLELDLLALDPTSLDDLEEVAVFARESWDLGRLEDYRIEHRAGDRHALAAALLTEPVLAAIRREILAVAPRSTISLDEIALTLCTEVLNPEVLLADRAESARKLMGRGWLPRSHADALAPVAATWNTEDEYALRESPGDICS